MKMIFTDDGPWAPGEQGARQRLAYVVRRWMTQDGLSVKKAAAVLATDKRWPRGVDPFSDTTIQNVAGLESAEEPEAKGSNMSSAWAICDYLKISAEWLFTGDGAPYRKATWATAAFEFELATRVLAKMPDAPRKPSETQRQVAVVGAKCFDAAVTAAREEWDKTLAASRERATRRTVLGLVESALRDNPDAWPFEREKYRSVAAEIRATEQMVDAGGFTILRPYPQSSNFAEPVDVGMALDGKPSCEYGYLAVLPPGCATRVGPNVVIVSRARKAAIARQAAEEKARQKAERDERQKAATPAVARPGLTRRGSNI